MHGKHLLITEAVRGESGRLFALQDGKPSYFMEEKYPELGNLMPRDVIARDEWMLLQQGKQIWLDMRHLDKNIQQTKLRGVLNDCSQFLSLDPTKKPIPVVPGIHYFMGGIWVDRQHRTTMRGLYASGECACQYHGANRLGGNSLLGAIYGGTIAAQSAMADSFKIPQVEDTHISKSVHAGKEGCYVDGILNLRHVLQHSLGIVREERTLQAALAELQNLQEQMTYDASASVYENQMLQNCNLLGQALLMSADARKESRGAHNRSDFPEENSDYQKQTVARFDGKVINITLESAGETNAH